METENWAGLSPLDEEIEGASCPLEGEREGEGEGENEVEIVEGIDEGKENEREGHGSSTRITKSQKIKKVIPMPKKSLFSLTPKKTHSLDDNSDEDSETHWDDDDDDNGSDTERDDDNEEREKIAYEDIEGDWDFDLSAIKRNAKGLAPLKPQSTIRRGRGRGRGKGRGKGVVRGLQSTLLSQGDGIVGEREGEGNDDNNDGEYDHNDDSDEIEEGTRMIQHWNLLTKLPGLPSHYFHRIIEEFIYMYEERLLREALVNKEHEDKVS